MRQSIKSALILLCITFVVAFTWPVKQLWCINDYGGVHIFTRWVVARVAWRFLEPPHVTESYACTVVAGEGFWIKVMSDAAIDRRPQCGTAAICIERGTQNSYINVRVRASFWETGTITDSVHMTAMINTWGKIWGLKNDTTSTFSVMRNPPNISSPSPADLAAASRCTTGGWNGSTFVGCPVP